MKLTMLLPIVMSLVVLPNISAAQSKEALHRDAQNNQVQHKEVKQHKSSHHEPVVVHKRVVYKTGSVMRKAPKNGLTIRFGGASFIVNDGIYYRHLNNGYTVVRPPIGLKVRSLPKGYERIVVRGNPLYFSLGIYYVFDNGYYRVIAEPTSDVIYSDNVSHVVAQSIETQQDMSAKSSGFQLGKAYSSLPQGAQSVVVSGQQYFKFRDIYFLAQSSGNSVHYLALKLD